MLDAPSKLARRRSELTNRVGIVHIDEVDKLARRGGNELGTWGGGRDVGGEGVQQALLRILEGTTVTLSAKSAPIGSNPQSPASHSSGSTVGSASIPPKAEASTPYEPPEWNPNNPMNRTFGNAPGKKGVRDGLPGFSSGSPRTSHRQTITHKEQTRATRTSWTRATSSSSSRELSSASTRLSSAGWAKE